jgi:hypothetical protein
MTKLMTGSELSELLSQTITPDQPVQLAVDFWGAGSMRGLDLEGHTTARLICNLTSGGTNPHEVCALIKSGVNVRMHNRLHAKIGIIGDRFSFVGSSNMSANGLGFEGVETAGWEEANTVFEEAEQQVSKRFEELWGQAKSIEQSDLKLAEKNWRSRRVLVTGQPDTSKTASTSLWDSIDQESEKLRALPCYVAYYYEMDDEEKSIFKSAMKDIEIEFGKNCSAFQDWSKLPEGYLIGVCRSRHRERIINVLDYSRRPPNAPIYQPSDGNFLVVEKLSSLPGFKKLSGGDLKKFKVLVLDYVDTKKKPMKSRIIPMQDLQQFHLNRSV